METKHQQYDGLVARRKKCRVCVGLCNPNVKELRHFDSDQIGPWTRLHGDLDARLMVVGQDWGDVNYFVSNDGLDKLNNPTMKNLELLLNSIGICVSLTSYNNSTVGLFLTNAILCLKTDDEEIAEDWEIEEGMEDQVNDLFRYLDNDAKTREEDNLGNRSAKH